MVEGLLWGIVFLLGIIAYRLSQSAPKPKPKEPPPLHRVDWPEYKRG